MKVLQALSEATGPYKKALAELFQIASVCLNFDKYPTSQL
jgi:hypothetical protein